MSNMLHIIIVHVVSVQNGDKLNECEQILTTHGSVTALCIDSANGSLVVGVQNKIRLAHVSISDCITTENICVLLLQPAHINL